MDQPVAARRTAGWRMIGDVIYIKIIDHKWTIMTKKIMEIEPPYTPQELDWLDWCVLKVGHKPTNK